MPVINRIADMKDEIADWRRQLHQHPELLYDLPLTTHFVEAKLKEFGCDEVVTGIGRSGIVGVIRGSRGDGSAIGLRADMDALPIEEVGDQPWRSTIAGKMHACGHDGHTAMLLGAAKYLAETRNFSGSVALIFQPAEEGGAGGLAMVQDGMMERFSIREVYGMHNRPGLPVGHFTTRAGPVMAASDTFEIRIRGKSSHASRPHTAVDPVLVSAHVVIALQSLVSRETDPLGSLVVSVTTTHGGTAFNVIPDEVVLGGTVRTLTNERRDHAEWRLTDIARATAAMFGGSAVVDYRRGYPVTVNHAGETAFALSAARRVAGDAGVNDNTLPVMGAEDFSYMLESRPGSFIFIGNGDTAEVHNSSYDFNDEAIPHGVSYWVTLVESALAA